MPATSVNRAERGLRIIDLLVVVTGLLAFAAGFMSTFDSAYERGSLFDAGPGFLVFGIAVGLASVAVFGHRLLRARIALLAVAVAFLICLVGLLLSSPLDRGLFGSGMWLLLGTSIAQVMLCLAGLVWAAGVMETSSPAAAPAYAAPVAAMSFGVPAATYCSSCAAPLMGAAAFCSRCGAKV